MAATGAAKSGFRRVGVVGMGLMGHGIAQVAAEAGYAVSVLDLSPTALAKGTQAIEKSLARVGESRVKKGKMDAAQARRATDEALARIDVRTSDLGAFAASGVDLIVEAIVEDLKIKRRFYTDLGKATPARCVFATNTSSFPVAELAQAGGRPELTFGLHFFNPVVQMALVEVVAAPKTSADVLTRAGAFVTSLGKTPVRCKDTPGFIVNRLLVPYLAEAMALVDRGDAEVEAVDLAMKLGAGHPMGPLYLADYIGLDTVEAILKGWEEKYPGFFVPRNLSALVAQGKLGRKSGQGFYPWPSSTPGSASSLS